MDTSYLTQQVTTIIGQLHKFFDEIGIPNHERDSRESELFASLSETLHNQLRLVANEKNSLVEEAQNMITTVQQMETSLEDPQSKGGYSARRDELKVTFPLLECLQTLRTKHKTVTKLHHERYEQVKKLVQALESYSSHLESGFLRVKLPPSTYDSSFPPTFDLSPSYINSVDAEFTRVYEEYTRRISVVHQLGEDIVKLWAELGTPQAQTDEEIVKHWREAPEQLGLHKDDISQLESRRDKLQDEKKNREKRVKELRNAVQELWDRLKIDESERKAFLASNRGCGLRVINDLEDEMGRLNELKRQNLHLFVEDARTRLQALWDEMFFSDEEAAEFTPMFCDVYSDALLSAHEGEIERLETLKEQRAPTLQLVTRHRNLVKEREELAASSQDASRLIAKKGERRDPTRLLREEKMRKRIAKELPKVEAELFKVLSRWEDEFGRPFLVFGERYLDAVESASAKPPPPRSKTPNPGQAAPQTKRNAPASAPKAAKAAEPPSSRPKTPAGTLTGQPQQQPFNKPRTAPQSPSRIPARVPLGNMPGGNNSPDRHLQHSPKATGPRKQNPGLLAPPPKMRDVHLPPPTPVSNPSDDVLRSGSVVRNVMPEDPYSDSTTRSQRQDNHYHNMPPPPRPGPASVVSSYSETNYTASTGSRQISASSSNATSHTSASGSENWETYGDDSDPEQDASDDYYARLRAAKAKRTHDAANGYPPSAYVNQAGKKMKAYHHDHVATETIVEAGEERRLVEGSEAGWTDEDMY